MKKIIFNYILLMFLIPGCFKKENRTKPEINTRKESVVIDHVKIINKHQRKKIIIFTSKGGGGHTSATSAIQSYIGSQYNVYSVNIFDTILKTVDLLKSFTFGYTSGEKLYNNLLQKNWFKTLNSFQRIGKLYFKIRLSKTTNLIRYYLEQEKPDVVISVIPIVNDAIHNATAQLNIPFILVPTDLDATFALQGMNQVIPHSKFHLALSFDDELIKKTVAPIGIPESKISYIGFPIRSSFLKQKNKNLIKKKFDIPENKPVVLVLMGAAGSESSYIFAKQLCKIKIPLHIISVLGRNLQLYSSINAIKYPQHISTTILGFTSQIAELMAVSDICLTKSGPGSVCEALYSNLPVLIDKTNPSSLWWERINHAFIKKHDFGRVIKNIEDIALYTSELLTQKNITKRMKINIASYEKKHFGQEIKKIIATMI